jgi:hypothetical protein
LGTVFSIGGDEYSGKCTDPAEVPDCKDYYGDLEFNKSELTKAGADTGPVRERVRSNSGNSASRNSVNRTPTENSRPNRIETQDVKRRPAPPSLQSILDEPIVEKESEPVSLSQFRPRPRPRPSRPSLDRLEESVIPTLPPAQATASPNRLQIITDRRPDPTTTTTTTTTSTEKILPTFVDPTPTAPEIPVEESNPPASSDSTVGLPDPVPAAPGPNGEEYYYYYYYYDEEEEN